MSDPIISTKDQVGEYDAIESAKPGEPLFPIQGGDPLGPKVVEFWADEARKLARTLEDPKAAEALLRKAYSAEQVAWTMQAYQRGEGEVPITRATYNDSPIIDSHEWKAGLVAGTRHCRDAAFHFTEAAEHLPDDQAAALLAAVEKINEIASAYEPKRASYGSQPELPIG